MPSYILHILCDQDRLELQEDINNLTQWANQWLIKLNIKKSKIVSYGRKINHNYPYYIDKVELEAVDSIKDLGVTFDSKLSFDISHKIQTEMTYPGQVKITVIRETRAVNIAK